MRLRVSLANVFLIVATWTSGVSLVSAQSFLPKCITGELPAPGGLFAGCLKEGMNLDQFMKVALISFRVLDANGDGKIDAEDAALLRRVANARAVAYALQKFTAVDLDGDGVVTMDELRLVEAYSTRDVPQRVFDRRQGAKGPPNKAAIERTRAELHDFAKADLDGDLRITKSEFLSHFSPRPQSGGDEIRYANEAATVIRIAAAGALNLSRQGYLDAATTLFATVDTDHDGVVSTLEAGIFNAYMNAGVDIVGRVKNPGGR